MSIWPCRPAYTQRPAQSQMVRAQYDQNGDYLAPCRLGMPTILVVFCRPPRAEHPDLFGVTSRAGQVRIGPDASAGSPRPSQARRRASDPDLLVVDAMVGVSSDDPHALDLSRHGISGVASVTSSGSFAAMSPSRPMTASPARRSGRSPSQRSLPSITSSAAASAASARSARRSLIPLVKGLRPRRGCGRPKA